MLLLRQIRKTKRARHLVFLVLFIASLALSVISCIFDFSYLRGVIHTTISVLSQPFHWLTRQGNKGWNWIHTQISLNEEAIQLRQRLESLEYYKTQRNLLAHENNELKKFFRVLSLFPKMQKIITRVISIPHFRLNVSMMIKTQAGIHLNSCVIGHQGLIGRVSHVGMLTSQVLLLTDSKSSIPAQIERTHHHAIVVGNNNQSLSIISSNDKKNDLIVGDILITSGIGGVYPANIPIARITSFSKDGQAVALPLIDPFSLDYVMVIEEKPDHNDIL